MTVNSSASAVLMGLLLSAQVLAGPVKLEPSRDEITTTHDGTTIAFRQHGNRRGRPILLIAGTGMQLIEWPPELIDGLVRQGFRVIVYDNRDAGRSSHFGSAGGPDWRAIFTAMAAGKTPALPYQASDMVMDAAALLDHLHIKKADVVGASGGATVAELLAIEQPERVSSLTLLMANAGDPAIPLPADPARAAAIPPPPAVETAQEQVERRIKTYRALAGKAYAPDDGRIRALAVATMHRDQDAQGVARQGAALIVLGDLRARLATIRTPTAVIHGSDDPLISPLAGREVADAIPGARFLLLEGMGHDLPPALIGPVLAAIVAVTGPRP